MTRQKHTPKRYGRTAVHIADKLHRALKRHALADGRKLYSLAEDLIRVGAAARGLELDEKPEGE